MYNDDYANNVNRDDQNTGYSQPESATHYNSYNVEAPKPVYENEVPKKKKGGFFKKAFAFSCGGLCFGLFAGIGLYAVTQVTDLSLTTPASTATPTPQISTVETVDNTIQKDNLVMKSVITSDVSDMVEEVMPAMVSIINNYTETTSYFGRTYSQEAQSSGSGIIIGQTEKELLIASNHHVVSGADRLDVTFIDDSVAVASIKGMDADMDLAVIAIPLDSLNAETMNNISIAKLGNSDELRLGEPVVAIGNALGYGQSVTGGYVSALNREIDVEGGAKCKFIQTDAAINPGNSGGALLNMNGEVIGINSSKIGGSAIEGMGYAIPISAAEPIIGELMLKETRVKITDGNVGYMGLNLQTITEDYAYMFNMPEGVYIRSIEENSPAQQAGMLAGDIICKMDGQSISSYEDLQEILQYFGPGSTTEVVVKRPIDGVYTEIELQITFGKRPE